MNGPQTQIKFIGSTVRLVVVATLLTILLAVPVLLEPTARLFGHEIVGFHPDAYIVIQQYESPPRLNHFTQPATDWPGALLGRWFGGVVAFNLIVLLTFPVTALATYLLTRKLGFDHLPGALVAMAFAFSPFHLAHAAYHPHVSQIQWIPLYLLALVLCLERWTALRGLLLVASAMLLIWSNFYAGLIGAVITPGAVVLFWMTLHRGRLRDSKGPLLGTLAVLGGLAGTGAIYAYLVAGNTVLGNARFAFPFDDLFRYCARWWSYLIPAVDHPLLGGLAGEIWRNHGIRGGLVEQQVYLGLVPLGLAVVALIRYLRGERSGAEAFVPALALLAVIAFVFSLPPKGHFLPVLRPSALLHSLLPMFRAYARFGLVVQLMVLLLAGIGLSNLLQSSRRSLRTTGVALVALAILELAPLPPWRWHWVLPTEAHRWADQQETEMRILDCHDARPGEVYRVRLMEHPTRLLSAGIPDCAEPQLPGKLAAGEYTHMLVRGDYRLADWVPAPGLATIESFEDSEILALTAQPAEVYVSRLGGFSWREAEGDATFRWMGSDAVLEISNERNQDLEMALHIELSSFPKQRKVRFELNGSPVDEIPIGSEPGRYTLAPLELRPGRNLLVLRADGDPAIPDKILGNGDRRSIAVRLWSWEFSGLEQLPAL